jgi:hypothetical protein
MSVLRKNLFYIVLFIFFFSCSLFDGEKKDSQQTGVYVKFADSTYITYVEEYTIGDSVYVLGGEFFEYTLFDTVEIIVESGLGDREPVEAFWPHGVDTDGLTRVHGGCISTTGSKNSNINNNKLEVRSTGDTIICYYIVKDETASDTAFVNP